MIPRADRRRARGVKCELLKNWVLREKQVLSELLKSSAFVAECDRNSKLFYIFHLYKNL